MFKNLKNATISIILLGGLAFSGGVLAKKLIAGGGERLAASVLQVYQGGTGAQTFTSGQCLIGNGAGPITSQACSAGGGGGGIFSTTTLVAYYNGGLPVIIGNNATGTPNTLFEVLGNVSFGTIASGTWNGTEIADAYIPDTITASNYQLLGNYVTQAYATSTYQPLGTYIDQSYGSSTYALLTTNYVTQAYGTSTYALLISNYATQAYASSTFYTKTEVDAFGYISQAYATSSFAAIGGAFHDGFSDFVANEHIDWTGASSGTIHTDNYVEGHSNGANCDAGNSPLGVDASGAVESCFDVWTEAENTSAGYITDGNTGWTNSYGLISTSSLFALSGLTDEYCLTYESTGGTMVWQTCGTGSSATTTWQFATSTATASQTVFDLPFTYSVGSNQLEVYVNGLKMTLYDDYTETDTDTITFVSGRTEGDKVQFQISGGATAGTDGTVTSVAMSVPTGLSISGSPVTTTGTLALSMTGGYEIVKTASTTEWATAYGWGDHGSAGYYTFATTTLDYWFDNTTGITRLDPYVTQAYASSTYAIDGGAHHDGFSDFVANEHINWTDTSSDFKTTGDATTSMMVITDGTNGLRIIPGASTSLIFF